MTSRAAGTRYARALFDVALKESADVQQIGRDLAAFAQMVSGNEDLARVLSNPAIPMTRKRGVVEQLLARSGAISPILSKILLLLADRDRLRILPDLAAGYRERLMQHANVVRAEVVTAAALPPDRVTCAQGRTRACHRTHGAAREPRRSVAHRRRGHARRQHRVRRQHRDAAAETETGARLG